MDNFAKISTTHAKLAMRTTWVQGGRARAPPLYRHDNFCVGGAHFGEIVHEGHRSTRQLPRNSRTAQYQIGQKVKFTAFLTAKGTVQCKDLKSGLK